MIARKDAISMKDCYEKIDEILGSLNSVCDANGLIRTMILAQMYGQIKELHTKIMNTENEWKNEKLKFEAEIQDLKEMNGRSK